MAICATPVLNGCDWIKKPIMSRESKTSLEKLEKEKVHPKQAKKRPS